MSLIQIPPLSAASVLDLVPLEVQHCDVCACESLECHWNPKNKNIVWQKMVSVLWVLMVSIVVFELEQLVGSVGFVEVEFVEVDHDDDSSVLRDPPSGDPDHEIWISLIW